MLVLTKENEHRHLQSHHSAVRVKFQRRNCTATAAALKLQTSLQEENYTAPLRLIIIINMLKYPLQ